MMKNGDPFVSIGGNEYEYSDIVKVIDGMYVVEQKSPSVGKKQQMLPIMSYTTKK